MSHRNQRCSTTEKKINKVLFVVIELTEAQLNLLFDRFCPVQGMYVNHAHKTTPRMG